MNTAPSANNDESLQQSSAKQETANGIDRRSFLMRNAVIGAAAVMTGRMWTPEARAAQAAKEARSPKWVPSSPPTWTS
jgi:L-serine dehydratase